MSTEIEKVEAKNDVSNQIVALANIVKALQVPEKIQANFTSLLNRMNPDKPGFEDTEAIRWYPPVVRIHQSVSTNPPANSKPGNLYTDAGEVLAQPLEFIPFYMHYGHVRFEPGKSSPTCRSEDAKVSIYGDVCAECPHRPFAKENERSECSKTLNFLVITKDGKEIYALQFSKTGYKTGSKLFQLMSRDAAPWERTYFMGTQQEARKGDRKSVV